ncbi:hypothetical protein HU200_058321 [Digitaria exilis]|uniref:Uncharacterized protein n=1 Tax=Digitaria exilis TaxID=1010633 RepID=A0A835AJM2_9POAL|nr:hypothetical protein HU200_058321 [Digitaria exilis]
MGQQTDIALQQITSFCGGSICSSYCIQSCNNKADAEYGKCSDSILESYENCSKNCTSDCNGKSFARDSCTMGSCSPSNCGNPCARGCCEFCTKAAPDLLFTCLSSHGTVMSTCMPTCMENCMPYCISTGGSAPSTP